MIKPPPYITSVFALLFFWGLTQITYSCKTKQKVLNKAISISEIQPYKVDQITEKSETKIPVQISSPCKNLENYYQTPEFDNINKMKYIRVNVHFINSLDSSVNYNPDTGVEYAKEMIRYANGKLDDNKKMNLPEGNETEVHKIPYRYVLSPDSNVQGDQGIYFHYVENPFFLNAGKYKNNYDKTIINKYAVNEDSVLNIFYMVHPPDSTKSKTYKVKSAGIALGNSLKLGVDFTKPANPWSYAGLLNHEVGHVLTLSHSWNKYDGCDDTPPHPNCWNTGSPPCDGIVSNNVMDYNSNQTAFTPCQIAKAYKSLSLVNSRQRGLVIKDWCIADETSDIIIQDSVVWNRVVDFNGNITIENKGYLYVACHLNMAKDTRITVKNGGQLVLENATIYNDCEYLWDGIYVEEGKNDPGKVHYIDTFSILNTKYIPVDN